MPAALRAAATHAVVRAAAVTCNRQLDSQHTAQADSTVTGCMLITCSTKAYTIYSTLLLTTGRCLLQQTRPVPKPCSIITSQTLRVHRLNMPHQQINHLLTQTPDYKLLLLTTTSTPYALVSVVLFVVLATSNCSSFNGTHGTCHCC
jgi:hypothetical protein